MRDHTQVSLGAIWLVLAGMNIRTKNLWYGAIFTIFGILHLIAGFGA